MEQPKIPSIPEQDNLSVPAEYEPKPSKLWIGAIVCCCISIGLSGLSMFFGFIPALVGLALGIVAFVLIWKDFELNKKMIAILTASVCVAFFALSCIVTNVVSNLVNLHSFVNYYSDDWTTLDRYDDDYYDFFDKYDHSDRPDYSFGGYDDDTGYIWD